MYVTHILCSDGPLGTKSSPSTLRSAGINSIQRRARNQGQYAEECRVIVRG